METIVPEFECICDIRDVNMYKEYYSDCGYVVSHMEPVGFTKAMLKLRVRTDIAAAFGIF